MCYTQRKIEGVVGALRSCDDTEFLKPNGQSRNLNVYDVNKVDFTTSQKMRKGVSLHD